MPTARTVQQERFPEDSFRLGCRTGAMAGDGSGQSARAGGQNSPCPPRLCRPAVRLAMRQKKKAGIPAWEPPPGERAGTLSIAG